MLTGKNVKASKAKRMGLVDQLVKPLGTLCQKISYVLLVLSFQSLLVENTALHSRYYSHVIAMLSSTLCSTPLHYPLLHAVWHEATSTTPFHSPRLFALFPTTLPFSFLSWAPFLQAPLLSTLYSTPFPSILPSTQLSTFSSQLNWTQHNAMQHNAMQLNSTQLNSVNSTQLKFSTQTRTREKIGINTAGQCNFCWSCIFCYTSVFLIKLKKLVPLSSTHQTAI